MRQTQRALVCVYCKLLEELDWTVRVSACEHVVFRPLGCQYGHLYVCEHVTLFLCVFKICRVCVWGSLKTVQLVQATQAEHLRSERNTGLHTQIHKHSHTH